MAKRSSKKSPVRVPTGGITTFKGNRPGSLSTGKGPARAPTNTVSSDMVGMSPPPIGKFKGGTKSPGNPYFLSAGWT